MRYLFSFLLVVSFSAWAQGSRPKKLSKAEQEEANKYLAAAKAIEIEKQLSESELLKECKTKPNATLDEIQSCVQQKITDPSFNAEEFAKKTNLRSFDLDASKDATSIRKYLSERLNRALYGEPDAKKMRKLVNQEVFYELYRTQIGNNILMDISNYCLSNFGHKNNPNIILNQCSYYVQPSANNSNSTNDPNKTNSQDEKQLTCASPSYQIKSTKNDEIDGDLTGKLIEMVATPNQNNGMLEFQTNDFKVSNVNSSDKFWDNVAEYELADNCDTNKDKQTCVKEITKKDNNGNPITVKMRNTSLINAIKEIEFKLGPDYLREKYSWCSFTIVHNMCELYRCRNIYNNETDQAIKEKCQSYGITVPYTPSSDLDKETGLKACSVVAKLKEYRRTLAALDKIEENHKGKKSTTGFNANVYSGGHYQGGSAKDELALTELTVISSDELVKNTNLGLSEEEAQQLRDECLTTGGNLSEDPKCQKLLANTNEDEQKNITAELEAETQLYLQRVKALENEEDIKQYLIKHGLTKYIDKIHENPELLKQLIQDQYKSERDALKKNMMDKFKQLTDKPQNSPNSNDNGLDANKVATDNILELEKQKERIQTLFQYNNVISSYLSAQFKDSDGKVTGEATDLSYIRQIEMKGLNEEKRTEYEASLGESSGGQKKGTSIQVDLKFIDTLLGNSQEQQQTP
jgi:hypothetical protein